MSKHRAHRVGAHRWPVFLGVCAFMLGGISLLVINSAASAHCTPVLSDCDHHWPVETSDTTTSGPTTETTTETTTTSSPTSTTTSTTTQTRPPAPTYEPPTGGGTEPTSTSGNTSGQTSTRPPGQLPTPKPQTPTADTPEDAGIAPAVPPSGGGTGGGTGGGGTGSGTAEITGSVPTAPPASGSPTEAVPPPLGPPAGNGEPVVTAIDPVSTSVICLLGADDSGGCAGAETARDLAPAGLLILGALALLGSGSFLESLRGSLRG